MCFRMAFNGQQWFLWWLILWLTAWDDFCWPALLFYEDWWCLLMSTSCLWLIASSLCGRTGELVMRNNHIYYILTTSIFSLLYSKVSWLIITLWQKSMQYHRRCVAPVAAFVCMSIGVWGCVGGLGLRCVGANQIKGPAWKRCPSGNTATENHQSQ